MQEMSNLYAHYIATSQKGREVSRILSKELISAGFNRRMQNLGH
jgi:hypothetical protein